MKSTPTATLEPLQNCEQAAALLGVCSKTIRNAIIAGELNAVRVGHRVLVEPADIAAYRAAHRTATKTPA
jgi:excisionase family DNA binding protein